MHTLYASPHTCSLAVQLTLDRLGLPHEVRWVGRGPGRQIADADYAAINPKRRVPTLTLPDGTHLTEVLVILNHLEQAHGPQRSPEEQRALLQWLSFLATDLHQQLLGPLFDPATPQAARDDVQERLLPPVLAHLEARLSEHSTLLEEPSSADAYLLWALVLLRFGFPESVATPGLTAFRRRMLAVPGVRERIAQQPRS